MCVCVFRNNIGKGIFSTYATIQCSQNPYIFPPYFSYYTYVYKHMCSHILHKHSLEYMYVCSLGRVRLFVTLWTVVHQAPLPMEFSSQEYWSGPPVFKRFLDQHFEKILLKLAKDNRPESFSNSFRQ